MDRRKRTRSTKVPSSSSPAPQGGQADAGTSSDKNDKNKGKERPRLEDSLVSSNKEKADRLSKVEEAAEQFVYSFGERPFKSKESLCYSRWANSGRARCHVSFKCSKKSSGVRGTFPVFR